MTATDLSDAAKECSDTNCHMFWHVNGETEFGACEITESIGGRLGSTLYLRQGNKLYK